MSYLVVLLAVLTRFIPHMPNFSPVFAVLLSGGAHLKRRDAIWYPLALLAFCNRREHVERVEQEYCRVCGASSLLRTTHDQAESGSLVERRQRQLSGVASCGCRLRCPGASEDVYRRRNTQPISWPPSASGGSPSKPAEPSSRERPSFVERLRRGKVRSHRVKDGLRHECAPSIVEVQHIGASGRVASDAFNVNSHNELPQVSMACDISVSSRRRRSCRHPDGAVGTLGVADVAHAGPIPSPRITLSRTHKLSDDPAGGSATKTFISSHRDYKTDQNQCHARVTDGAEDFAEDHRRRDDARARREQRERGDDGGRVALEQVAPDRVCQGGGDGAQIHYGA